MMDFKTEALHQLRIFAVLNKGKLFTAEEVTAQLGWQKMLSPREQRKWGPVFLKAKREGTIKQAKHDGRPLYVPRYNGSPQPVYTC
jgi:hypothetical protein